MFRHVGRVPGEPVAELDTSRTRWSSLAPSPRCKLALSLVRNRTMKRLFIILAYVPLWAGCNGSSGGAVKFEWFNLSTNEIWVTDVVGLPPEASPGRLTPNHAEAQLEVSASVFSEAVGIADDIQIAWKDNGKEGWPGGLAVAGSIPPGTAHQVALRRAGLRIPAKLNTGRVRFTYLGTNTWRVRMIAGSDWE